RPIVHRSRIAVTAGLGLLVGATAAVCQLVTRRSFTEVLFSGQNALPGLVENAAGFSLGVLVALSAWTSLAYGLSLSAFRGGPIFPAMCVGGAIGIAASGLPGVGLAGGIGMGIGAMAVSMLRLPLTSTLLATLLMGIDGILVTPQVVLAVATA